MKMYKIDDIIELLQLGKESENDFVGFELDEDKNIVMTFKTHAPGWRDEEGFGEAVEEITLLECEGEY